MADDKTATLSSPWLSQLTAAVAIVATSIGRVVAPGLRGAASQQVVDTWESIGHFTTYALLVFLVFLFLRAAWDLIFTNKPSIVLRILVVSGAFSVACIVMCILVVSMLKRPMTAIPPSALATLTVLASLAALLTAAGTLRLPHTRAVGFVLMAFGIAALVRVLAWWLADVAGARAAPMTYEWARGLATIGVIFEGVGQFVGVIWLTTRTRVSGQILAAFSVVAALVVTWAVGLGGHAGASTWQVVLHTSLSSIGTPSPAGLGLFSTFLAATSILFAATAVIRPGPAPAITSALALCLIARGAFDSPLNALCVCVGAACLLAASVDERTMWQALAGRDGDNRKTATAASTETATSTAPETATSTETAASTETAS